MANRMIHTPSYLATADIDKYWTSSAASASIDTGWYKSSGVSGGGGVTRTWTGGGVAGWTVGFRFKYTTTVTSTAYVVEFYDGTIIHTSLSFVQSTGIFALRRGTTVLLTSTTPLSVNTEYNVELQTTIADSGGVGILKVDGVTDSVINSSSLDTRNAGNASSDGITFLGSAVNGLWLKDIYINDNSGGVDDTFWGPVTVATLTPSADGGGGGGGTNDWTPLSSTNVSNVDDATPDDDTTYNATSTNGDIDTYTMTNTGYASGTVKGVEWVADVRRTDSSATARVAPVYRISSTNYVRTDIVPTTTYRLQPQVDRLSPATSSAWTVSELDGIEVGYKRSAA